MSRVFITGSSTGSVKWLRNSSLSKGTVWCCTLGPGDGKRYRPFPARKPR